MNLRTPLKPKIFFTVFLSFHIFFNLTGSEALGSLHHLPFVSPAMNHPEFWLKKIRDPNRKVLDPSGIDGINNELLRNPDLYLSRVQNMKEEWSREELLALLREDWQGLGETSEVRFNCHGIALDASFYRGLKKNRNENGIKDRNGLLWGIMVERTDIRVFPTDICSLASPAGREFDRYQHSMIPPGALVALYHDSEDGRWVYIQTGFIRGWVRRETVAFSKEKGPAFQFEEAGQKMMITGNFVPVYNDPDLKSVAFQAQMGTAFPLLQITRDGCNSMPSYTIRIPHREKEGQLTLKKGYISCGDDVHPGPLPYTQSNVAGQAFKMLHQPYGWGEVSGGRDCSRFILDINSTFGFLFPRNSKFQARVGIDLGGAGGKTAGQKRKILDRAPPFLTTLRLPGHIMLYLGKHKGKYYAIHSIYGVQRNGAVLDKIGGVVVSDLSLGETGLNGSLMERLTDVRFVGDPKGLEKVRQSP
jgi:hypothetical protein